MLFQGSSPEALAERMDKEVTAHKVFQDIGATRAVTALSHPHHQSPREVPLVLPWEHVVNHGAESKIPLTWR